MQFFFKIKNQVLHHKQVQREDEEEQWEYTQEEVPEGCKVVEMKKEGATMNVAGPNECSRERM